MKERIGGRGMKAMEVAEHTTAADFSCDAAILLLDDDDGAESGRNVQSSHVKRALLPGGFLYLVISITDDDDGDARRLFRRHLGRRFGIGDSLLLRLTGDLDAETIVRRQRPALPLDGQATKNRPPVF
mmetsp:Transcript_36392/g.77584  ORF Transcript_36392/g.77584 Transcript_36392/m.77584 type:complete len:128 (-) Transcript_36392:594-977(-)